MAESKSIVIENTNDFDVVVRRYYENNTNLKTLKKAVENDGDSIKAYLLSNNGEDSEKISYTVDDINANITKVVKNTMEEEPLIKFLETLNIPGVLKTKVVIDEEALEDAIYHNMIDPEALKPFMHETVSYRLLVNRKKK